MNKKGHKIFEYVTIVIVSLGLIKVDLFQFI
jgi:hypothetical protein